MVANELIKLAEYLVLNNYHVTFNSNLPLSSMNVPFTQIRVYGDSKCNNYRWDAICHDYSMGHKDGLIEIMGDIVRGDEQVEGYLTAEEVISRLNE